MTNEAATARENAQHCEAKKHALRQTQDGIVVSFVLHPSDVPASLQLAALGTRYMLALVEIGDDEQAKVSSLAPAPEVKTPAPVQARNWNDIPLSQQAGILCSDPKFRYFLADKQNLHDEEHPQEFVRRYCEVQSRSEIRPGTTAEQRWNLLVSAYRAWDMAPSVGAA